MNDDEKKHFILKLLANEQFKNRCPDTSYLTASTIPSLSLPEVNTLCRKMELDGVLKTTSTMDNAKSGTLIIIPTTVSVDAYLTKKYLHPKSVSNLEFEILNYLYESHAPSQIRINHILFASQYSVFDTIQVLKELLGSKFIQIQPPPLSLMRNDNGLITDHELAFENLFVPILAKITSDGRTYFKTHYSNTNSLIMKNISITTGDGSIVNTGDNAKIKATINIKKGEKADLKRLLLENSVSEEDANDLIKIIDNEIPEKISDNFGTEVNSWMGKMFQKSLNGTWQIGVGAAGNVLADLINTYYHGLK